MSQAKKEVQNYLQRHKNYNISKDSKSSSKTKPPSKAQAAKPTRASYKRALFGKTPTVKIKPCLESLPDELLLKIFSYLGPVDIVNGCRVCKRWNNLCKDRLLWEKIYKENKFETKSPVKKLGIVEQRETNLHQPGPAHWKAMCFEKCRETVKKKVIPMLKKISPYTGIEAKTKEALQKAGVAFELCFVDRDGAEHTMLHNDLYHFNMSACARWYGLTLPARGRIRTLKLFATVPVFFDNKGAVVPNSPRQRSLMFETEFKWSEWIEATPPHGSDDMIDVHMIPGGLMVATWKDGKDIAFITANFHAHNLVRRCILGSNSNPYQPPPHRPVADDIDSKYGLHDYCCTIELRNQRTSFWSLQKQYLHALGDDIGGGMARIVLLDPDDESHRSTVAKQLAFLWKTDAFKGTIKNMCFLDMTLLDERRQPMWCVSSCVTVTSQQRQVTYAFDGNKTQIIHEDEKGRVVMQFSWEEEESTYYMLGLELYLKLQHVNRWFGTRY